MMNSNPFGRALTRTLLFVIVQCAMTVSAQAQCDMPQGFHEFETFGEKAVFLSHYPMFGSIHSYQIVVRADLSVDGKNVNELLFNARKSNPGTNFSTSPVRPDGSEDYWVLPDYTKVGTKFKARVHYVNSRKQQVTLLNDVLVEVKEVLVHQRMDQPAIGAKRAANPSYYYFGNESEAYLLHQMFWHPDYDQILQVKPLPVEALANCKTPVVLTFPSRKNDEKARIQNDETVKAAPSCAGEPSFKVVSELYQDTMTIQH